ncbi:hypothetical protein DMA11_13090 [Marinilabiliaceae bacterium JC017]|nr:hypothetical protein DMA11_13090 [Marinilabiliaceae bacterium JC017]
MKQHLLYPLIIVFILLGCTDINRKNFKSEGTIEYRIDYPPALKEESIATFLPEKMTTFFKKDHFKIKLTGSFNLYNLEYLSRSGGDSCFTVFKVLGKSMFYPLKKKETLFLYNDLGHPKVKIYKDSIKNIAGFDCQKAVLSFPKPKTPKMTTYFTKELGVKNPNRNTPFSTIPGVLMEFSLNYQDISLKLIAEKFNNEQVESNEFMLPSDYETTTQKEMEDIIASLLQ